MTSAAALAVSLGAVLFSALFCAWNWRNRRRELTETVEKLERMIEAAERGEAPSALETGSGETLPVCMRSFRNWRPCIRRRRKPAAGKKKRYSRRCRTFPISFGVPWQGF